MTLQVKKALKSYSFFVTKTKKKAKFFWLKMEFSSHPSLSVHYVSQPPILKSASLILLISHFPGQDPVPHPNKILGHRFLT